MEKFNEQVVHGLNVSPLNKEISHNSKSTILSLERCLVCLTNNGHEGINILGRQLQPNGRQEVFRIITVRGVDSVC
jgi:hypothetical protein